MEPRTTLETPNHILFRILFTLKADGLFSRSSQPSQTSSRSHFGSRYAFVFRFSLDPMECREPFDVHVEFLAVLILVQTLLHAVQKLTSGSQPSPPVVSRSRRRLQRQKTTLRKLFAAWHGNLVESVDKGIQVDAVSPRFGE